MHTVDVIVETPKGHNCKYKFDEKKKQFRLKKLLPAGLAFPYDFGFIPGTKAEDGDPLDVLIYCEDSFLQGSVVACTIIYIIEAEQTEDGKTVRNDRIIGVPIANIEAGDVHLTEISKKKMKEIEDFFVYYNQMEGKKFKPLGVLDGKEAWKVVKKQL
jgi:inorganic pyrophosphatase